MHNEEISSTNKKSKKWYASSRLAICSMFASFIIWISIFGMTAGVFEVKPTQMILKSDGCNYLRQIGIQTNYSKDESNCTVNVPYRLNSFGNGGVIVLDDDRQIRIADNQVLIVSSIENQPWTPSQNHAAILIATSSIFMFCMVAWFSRFSFSSIS